MLKNKKNMMIVWVLLVVAFIGFLVFVTINNKNDSSNKWEDKKINMQNVDGIKVTVLKEGNGDVAESGNMIAVAYTGMLADGTVFDSNTDQKFGHVEPFAFTLGAGQVIKGWDLGVVGMKVGEQRKLDIAPEFAYGANEIAGVIPANSTLTFIVELLAVQK
jgi:FKBP-type peptidyl-prolyl cis-trans isomerase